MKTAWLLMAALAWPIYGNASEWVFSAPLQVTADSDQKVFHHLESAGRRNIAISGETVAISWEDDRDGTPRVYMALKKNAAADFSAELKISGNGEAYDLRLRTDQLTRAWQSFRTDFVAAPDWQSIRFPFDGMIPHRTEAAFDPARLRRVGVLGIGREFRAEVAVAAVRFYRT